MLLRTTARSSGVRATHFEMAPTPRSKPSNTTYATNMIATSTNQNVTMVVSSSLGRFAKRGRGRITRLRRLMREPARDHPGHQQHERDRQQRVQPHEPEQREQPVAGRH